MDNKSVTECVVRNVVANECAAIEARRRMLEEPSNTTSRLQTHLQRLSRNKVVNPDGGPYGDFLKRAGGGIRGFAKRMGRHFVSWYLEPVFRKQTDFNNVTAALLGDLLKQVGTLEASNAQLKSRNEQLAQELSECQIELARRLSEIEALLAGKHGEL